MEWNAWSRWGRGSCEGYSLRIGGGSFVRFEASVTRGIRGDDGSHSWRSDINGACGKTHATMEEAMMRVEQELAIAGKAFLEGVEEFKANRSKNRYSQAVDASRNGTA